jgi:photosystem II stability/assembly factor-like uncharacterized protein
MKNIALILLVVSLFFPFRKQNNFLNQRKITKVEIESIIVDSTLNVRAISVLNEDGCLFVTSDGRLGTIINAGAHSEYSKANKYITEYPLTLSHNGEVLNFRSMALVGNAIFALSIDSPALLYKITEGEHKIVYQEEGEGVFYDSMDFWNEEEGIAIGDTIDGCLSIIITRDGGETWNKLSCDVLPIANEGEGAFAASDTNISIIGDFTWVATTAGRVYYSENKGVNWNVIQTPIVKDKETEGIYSIAFYDDLNGFAIGGDYTKPDDSTANKIHTEDGGKTWQLIGQNQSPGYRSCVQYIPNSEGQELVTIGFKGIDYSNDSGSTWNHLSDEGYYTLRFLNDSTAYAAGNKRISKLTFKE